MAQDSAPPGIIDTLSAGFSSINRIAWVLLVPVLLDLFLWQGPRLSAEPVAQQFLKWYGEQLAVASPAAGEAIVPILAQLGERLASFNALYFLVLHAGSLALIFGGWNLSGPKLATIPSFMVGQAGPNPASPQVSGGSDLMMLAFLLGLAGILLGTWYLGIIAQQVRGRDLDGGEMLARLAPNWINAASLLFGGMIFCSLAMLPILIVLSLLALISQSLWIGAVLLTGAAMQVGIMAAFIYLFFTVDAIVVSGVGPIRAVRNSIAVVNNSFWAAVGLIVASYIILAGTQVIWALLIRQSLGPMPGILGNAYIVSGLTAASMVFYRDRLALVERKNNGRTDNRED